MNYMNHLLQKEMSIFKLDYTKDHVSLQTPLFMLWGILIFQILLPLNIVIFLHFTPLIVYFLLFLSFLIYSFKNDMTQFVKFKLKKDMYDDFRFCHVSENGDNLDENCDTEEEEVVDPDCDTEDDNVSVPLGDTSTVTGSLIVCSGIGIAKNRASNDMELRPISVLGSNADPEEVD